MLSTRTVLIADDDRALRESLGEAIADLGWQTRMAASGGEAIHMLGRDRCDLLLSDVDMPDMTGFQLLSWIHQHPPEMPVVLMSARADAQLLARAKADGAITLLSKPVRFTELTTLIHHLACEGNHHHG
jgi:DNA-binding NtrC family response regulator